MKSWEYRWEEMKRREGGKRKRGKGLVYRIYPSLFDRNFLEQPANEEGRHMCSNAGVWHSKSAKSFETDPPNSFDTTQNAAHFIILRTI
jgi:hypothetical protein